MATLVITIVTPDSVAMVTDQLQGVGTTSNSNNAEAIMRAARYLEGVSNGSFNQTSFTTAVS